MRQARPEMVQTLHEVMANPEERPDKEEGLSQGTATEEEEEEGALDHPGHLRKRLSQNDEESEEEAEEEGEEGKKSRGMRDVIRVSKEEREDHKRTHTPYRPWCPYCVKGGGITEHHRKGDKGEEIEVPRVSMDCLFTSSEDEKPHRNPLVVTQGRNTPERSDKKG